MYRILFVTKGQERWWEVQRAFKFLWIFKIWIDQAGYPETPYVFNSLLHAEGYITTILIPLDAKENRHVVREY